MRRYHGLIQVTVTVTVMVTVTVTVDLRANVTHAYDAAFIISHLVNKQKNIFFESFLYERSRLCSQYNIQ
jgi:hypothetical protein